MPLNLPDNAQQVETKARTDVERARPGANPFLKNSALGALVTAFAFRIFDFYIQLRAAAGVLFPDTADGEFLERWAAIFGKTRTGATIASGSIAATGTLAASIPAATVFVTSDGTPYETTALATIAASSLSVTSLTRSGTIATAVTATDHGLGNNVEVTISGAVQSEYNGAHDITVTAANEFTFSVAGTPATPASGTILADFESAFVPVESQGTGAAQNVPVGAQLSLQSPVAGVDNAAGVTFGGIEGGTNQETTEELRGRTLERVQNPVAHFSVNDITEKAREVAGVTRVFVEEVTPAVGQVTIYFMRDNDDDPVPSAPEVADVLASILQIKPANTATADVIVAAPTAVPTAFTFTDLQPNTATMQAAVTATLEQFFAEETTVGEDVDEDAYRGAIISTIDLETGSTVDSFTLSTPSGDVSIASGEIGTLGTVTFP